MHNTGILPISLTKAACIDSECAVLCDEDQLCDGGGGGGAGGLRTPNLRYRKPYRIAIQSYYITNSFLLIKNAYCYMILEI